MKKIVLVTVMAFLLAMCKSASVDNVADVHHKDDFEGVSANEKKALLKELKATDRRYSVLIFTENYGGEKIIASTAGKRMYADYVTSNPTTGVAATARIENNANTRVYDNFNKKEIVIHEAEAKKHKFIYLKKNLEGDTPYTITYSNTLRPLE
ncbi:hypothetical protein [Flavobacterium subsaxonicum]|uniref:Lipoprotein n=1 Tax=Flavobacterium subsaxonicum WB 4.1-42 = DSM 21790 TaxID=1121898 RepID=A0A0A2MFQ7_9FLAO|nr:hypothetical protein [Flavobacterium subsaxonicum]KGO91527.1 hypothetical protein Q766_17505 [Flavobacterium subsaxonicum WB 4.1-42 = DSM 21790]